MAEENRLHERYPYIELVTLIAPGERSYASQSENISMSGIFLVKENPLPEGTRGFLDMKINDGGAKKVINSKFRIIHNGQSQQGQHGMGVEFIDMPEEDQSLLQRVIQAIQQEQ